MIIKSEKKHPLFYSRSGTLVLMFFSTPKSKVFRHWPVVVRFPHFVETFPKFTSKNLALPQWRLGVCFCSGCFANSC